MTFSGTGLPEVGGQATAEGQNSPEVGVEEVEADLTTEEGVDPLKETLDGSENIMNGVRANHQTPDPEEIV